MKKLMQGILDFRKNVLPQRREQFARLAAEGQTPDVLFITCSDSRVAPNWFASTDPGDLFVIRNIGNLVPVCDSQNGTDSSVAAAIEFAVSNLQIAHIVVCGHSGCGGIHALAAGIEKLQQPHLKNWLSAEARNFRGQNTQNSSDENELSRQNVLRQIENLKTYPLVRERFEKGTLQLHAWWFDIAHAGVYSYNEKSKQFALIDGKNP